MFTASKKIVKESGEPDEIEKAVAQALFDLEASPTGDLKSYLRGLHIVGAQEFECPNGKTALVVWVPFRQLKQFHRIQRRLVSELEKKFSGKSVVLVAKRKVLPKITRKNHLKQQRRPRSRTLTAVHESILDDIVYPTEIVGKRIRVKIDGARIHKIHLDRKDQTNVEHKLDAFATVYKKLTGKDVTFEFPTSLDQ